MEHWRLERWRSSHAMPCRMRILPASRHMWKAFGSGRVDTVVSRVAASMWRVAAAGSPVSLYGFRKETTSLQERNFAEVCPQSTVSTKLRGSETIINIVRLMRERRVPIIKVWGIRESSL